MMKRLCFLASALALLVGLLSSCTQKKPCPACGREVNELYECPICYMDVCEYCSDEEWYIEELFNSGRMQEYLEQKGYIVFSDNQEPYGIYAYGFLSGFEKGESGVIDEEVEEFLGWDYEKLEQEYGEYGY